MNFGEVKLVLTAPWAYDQKEAEQYGAKIHEYPVVLLARTCRMVRLGPETYYCAVLVPADSEDPSCYLCIWNSDGRPRAVHCLTPDKGSASSEVETAVDGDAVSVSGPNIPARRFPITGRNDGNLPPQ